MPLSYSLAAVALLACLYPPDAPADPDERPSRTALASVWKEAFLLAKTTDDTAQRSEAVRMAAALLKGDRLGPGSGWYGPSQSRYGWAWLAARMDADRDGRITRAEFSGPAELFNRLDRDRDGAITAEDLDWTERSGFMKQQAQAAQLLKAIDGDGDGQISPE